MSAEKPTRAENLARAKGDKGLAGDTDKGNFRDRNHKFGYMAISMEGLDLGEPWRADKDPNHDCQANRCKVGRHYFKPTFPQPWDVR